MWWMFYFTNSLFSFETFRTTRLHMSPWTLSNPKIDIHRRLQYSCRWGWQILHFQLEWDSGSRYGQDWAEYWIAKYQTRHPQKSNHPWGKSKGSNCDWDNVGVVRLVLHSVGVHSLQHNLNSCVNSATDYRPECWTPSFCYTSSCKANADKFIFSVSQNL